MPAAAATAPAGAVLHHRTCHLCEALCGLVITHDGAGHIRSIRGDPEDPLSRGHLCPKAVALQDLQADPDRLRRPLKRSGDRWLEIGWDEAFDEAARGLQRVRARHGDDALASYTGNPTAHNTGALLVLAPYLAALRTRNRYSARSIDQLPNMFVNLQMFGSAALFAVPDLDRCELLLMIGANPAASQGSIASAGDFMGRIAQLRARGGRVYLLDPRRTESAAKVDRHWFIRPGSDVFLLAAMIHTLFDEGRVRLGRLADFTDGVESLRTALSAFTPEAASTATGIAADEIRLLARDFAGADRAICYGRIGGCLQDFGGLVNWLITALNVLTGNLDRAGGVMFTHPAIDIVGMAAASAYTRGSYDRYRSRVRGLPEFMGELPVAVLAEEMLTPGPGQIRGLVTLAGNPVLSTPDGRRLERALSGLEFMVSIDCYLNETTRHAHLILPPAGPLEREHYGLALNAVAVRNVAKYSPPLLPAAADTRHDWQILLELAARLGPRNALERAGWGLMRRLIERLGVDGLLDLLLRAGPYGRLPRALQPTADALRDFLAGEAGGGRLTRMLAALPARRSGLLPVLRAQALFSETRRGLDLATLKAHPHGLDLGPLRPGLPEKLCTPGRRIRLTPPLLLADLPRALARLSRPPAEGLVLIGRRHLRSNNSWMHNTRRLVKGPERCTLLLHPLDAAAAGLVQGQMTRVESAVGSIALPAEITADIMPGVVCAPHGYGHHRPGTRLTVASRLAPGASVNDITDAQRVDPLTGVAAVNGLPVRLYPSDARAPLSATPV
ncbi:MAG: molybdopterin-dependent oxidoreductase [Pseudomonadota bacterium]